jgi:predicted dehydrogenase
MERREFLKQAALGTASLCSAARSALGIIGANDRVNLGLVGAGGRGQLLMKLAAAVPNVEFTAVCDLYPPQTNAALQLVGSRCRAYNDFRKLLEQKDVDAVLIATPDHWHSIPTILACKAGKDVYVEKPLAYSIKEGRAMVDAARQNRRVVQVGTQHRSAPHFRQVEHIVQSGQLGPVHFVRVWNYLNMSPDGLGRTPDSNPPAGLDWDFYLGPAPTVPFNENRFLRTYRWFWDYAGGMTTDFGTHRFDTVHQVMHADHPLTVMGWGRRYELNDGADVPDALQITYEYPGFILSYEASMLNGHGVGAHRVGGKYYGARGSDDRPHGMAFYGSNGSLFADRIGFEVYPEPKESSIPGLGSKTNNGEGWRTERAEAEGEDATGLHLKNFIDCIRSREKPVADIEIGHHSTIVPHLGNISIRTGHKLRWDATKEEIVDDQRASALLFRQARKPWDGILQA